VVAVAIAQLLPVMMRLLLVMLLAVLLVLAVAAVVGSGSDATQASRGRRQPISHHPAD
jgi:hypothetical protein